MEELKRVFQSGSKKRSHLRYNIFVYVNIVYNELSQYIYSNNRKIIVRTKNYRENLLAIIIMILRVKGGWLGGV